jgi:hypothetical protein
MSPGTFLSSEAVVRGNDHLLMCEGGQGDQEESWIGSDE